MTSPIHPPTPPEIVYAMHAYYCEGHSLHETGKKFGFSTNSVYRSFKRHNLPVRSRSHALYIHYDTDAETRAMYADYKAGMSTREIAKNRNYSKSTVQSRFKASKLQMRPPHLDKGLNAPTSTQLRTLEAIRQYVQAHGKSPTYVEMGKLLGVSKSAIRRHVQMLERHGLLTRSQSWKHRQIQLVEAA